MTPEMSGRKDSLPVLANINKPPAKGWLPWLDRGLQATWWILLVLVAARIVEVAMRADGDLTYFFNISKQASGLPGWTESWAYPPLAGVIILPMKYFGIENASDYFLLGIALPVILLSCLLLWKSRLVFWRASIAYYIAVVVLSGVLFFYRFDSVTVLTSMLALILVGRKRQYSAGAFLALGGLIKFWPLLIAAVLGTVLRGKKVLVSAGIIVAVVTVAGYISGNVPWSWLTFTQDRGLQAESFAALPGLWARHFSVDGYEVPVNWYGANVEGPYLSLIFMLLIAASLILIMVVTYRAWPAIRLRSSGIPWTETSFAYLLLTLTLLLICSPVLSPQFTLWLAAPLAIALGYGWLQREAALSLLVISLSGLVYPYLYPSLILEHALVPLLLLTARDALLVSIVFSVVIRLWKKNLTEMQPEHSTVAE